MAFYQFKKNKLWIWKAVDRTQRRTIAWVVGNRDAKLYDKVKHVTGRFYTDDWEVYSKIFPKDRHIIGKAGTTIIESNNANTRHHLGRMTRQTKVVSKSAEMVDLSMRLWCFLQDPQAFEDIRSKFASLFYLTLPKNQPPYEGFPNSLKAFNLLFKFFRRIKSLYVSIFFHRYKLLLADNQ